MTAGRRTAAAANSVNGRERADSGVCARVWVERARAAGLARVDVRGRLGEVAVPTLDACGARDRANLGPSREIAAGVPGAELRIVPDAVHLWNLQQPELFNETVAEFVAQVFGPDPRLGGRWMTGFGTRARSICGS